MGCVAAARSMPRRRSDASQDPRTCSGLPSSCPAERGYLHELVHGAPRQPLGHAAEKLPQAVADLVDRLDPHPTYVTGRRWDVLAANRAARAVDRLAERDPG